MSRDLIKITRGLEKDMNLLQKDEPGYTEDTHKLYMGTGDGSEPILIGGKGDPGDKGDPGRGISSIEQITNNTGSSAANTIRVTYTDGTTQDFTVYNGGKGDKGDTTETASTALILAKTIAATVAGMEEGQSVPDIHLDSDEYRGFNPPASLFYLFNSTGSTLDSVLIGDGKGYGLYYKFSQPIPEKDSGGIDAGYALACVTQRPYEDVDSLINGEIEIIKIY